MKSGDLKLGAGAGKVQPVASHAATNPAAGADAPHVKGDLEPALPDAAALQLLSPPPNAESVGRSTGQRPATLAGQTGAFDGAAARALESARSILAEGPKQDSIQREARAKRIGAAIDDAIRAVEGRPAAQFLLAVRPFFMLHNESYSGLMMPAVFDAATALLEAPVAACATLQRALSRSDHSSHALVALGAAAAALLGPENDIAQLIDRELGALRARHSGMYPVPAATAAALGRIGLAIEGEDDARGKRRALLSALAGELERNQPAEQREGSLRAIGLLLAKMGEAEAELPGARFAARLARWLMPSNSSFSGALLRPGLELLEVFGRPPAVARPLILDRLGKAEGMHPQLVLGMAAAALTPPGDASGMDLEAALGRAEARLGTGGLFPDLTASVVAAAYRTLERIGA